MARSSGLSCSRSLASRSFVGDLRDLGHVQVLDRLPPLVSAQVLGGSEKAQDLRSVLEGFLFRAIQEGPEGEDLQFPRSRQLHWGPPALGPLETGRCCDLARRWAGSCPATCRCMIPDKDWR